MHLETLALPQTLFVLILFVLVCKYVHTHQQSRQVDYT